MANGNRMVEKSKAAIKSALLKLMDQKDFSEITVSELLTEANISRGTFYAHFNNLEDVRHQLISDMFRIADDFLADHTASELAEDPHGIMLAAAQKIYGSERSAEFFRFVNVYDLGISLKDWLTNFLLKDPAFVKAFGGDVIASINARFIAGGLMHAFNMWIQDGYPVSPEVLADTCCRILMGGMNSVR